LVQPPQVCFEQALAALAEEARTGAWPPLPARVAG
jgi:hypothetical protein